jgi:photosystem II stability/assembly factor-like uncharacterized protein
VLASHTTATVAGGVVLADGRILLGTYSGQLLISDTTGRNFSAAGEVAWPVTGLVQTSSGTIVVVGAGGVTHLDLSHSLGG